MNSSMDSSMNSSFVKKLIILFLGTSAMKSLTAYPSSAALPGTEVLHIETRKIENIVRRDSQASYTLVFENGVRNCINRWDKLLPHLPTNLNIYIYNRPGYCGSSKADTPRTSENIVNELRQALKQQSLNPPYVLIGHSMGGLYMQHFARQYPEEVKGLVLVDAIYPGIFKHPDTFPWYTKLGMSIFLPKDMRGEINLAHASGLMIDALPAIDDIPVVRMFNEPKSKIADGTAKEIDLGMLNRNESVVTKVSSMYPHAKVVVADSSHQMQEASPELVAQAIQDVIHGDLKIAVEKVRIENSLYQEK